MVCMSGGSRAAHIRRWYGVVGGVLVMLIALLVASPASAASPHGGYNSSSTNCASCHRSHQASSSRSLFAAPDETGVCYAASCHAAGSAADVQATFSGGSGHRVEQLTAGGDLTNGCSSCHKAHLAAATNPGLPRPEINGATVNRAAEPNSWCGACHNDTHDWQGASKGSYPALLTAPSRDATGYPVLGTFPGKTTYGASLHATIPPGTAAGTDRGEGDCLWCHASHRGPNGYDGLLATFRPTTAATLAADQSTGQYAASCLGCHDGSTAAFDIKQQVTSGTSGAGHRVRTSGGTLPKGAPLPCYECHNPHGSALGNTAMISDALGGNLDPRGDAAHVRQFCFTCHTTGDLPHYGWDSDLNDDGSHDDGGYVVATGTVAGLRRDSWMLALSANRAHMLNGDQSCFACHGDVHAPGMGVSKGGTECYTCHASYEESMDQAGAFAANFFHHTLGTASPSVEFPAAGDAVFADDGPGGYPEYPTDGDPADTPVYCLSCHVDHNYFNGDKAGNLRDGLVTGAQTPTNTDFDAVNEGVCLGCHTVERTKDTTSRMNNGTSITPAISAAMFAGSAHNYTVQSGAFRDNSTFQANCAKCHRDDQGANFQDEPSFRLHWSTAPSILALLGRAADPDTSSEEGFCYRCHSAAGDGLKTAADADSYGSRGMSAASQAVYGQFQSPHSHALALSNSAHKPSYTDEVTGNRLSAGQHVECADCHSAHAAGSETASGLARENLGAPMPSNLIASGSPLYGVWGVEPPTAPFWTEPSATGYTIQTSATKEYQICLKCHSTFRSADWAAANAGGWTNQALEFNPNNATYHPVMATTGANHLGAEAMKAPWKNVGNQTMYCSDCHMSSGSPEASGPHGSAYPHLLRGYWRPGVDSIATEDGTTDLLCNRCHEWRQTGPHTWGGHGNADVYCTSCHSAVPHGSPNPGLLSMVGEPAPYNQGALLEGVIGDHPTRGSSTCSTNCHPWYGL